MLTTPFQSSTPRPHERGPVSVQPIVFLTLILIEPTVVKLFVFNQSDRCCSVLVLSMPDTVEEMCPEMPQLEKLLKDVNDISESGARYSDMPQV